MREAIVNNLLLNDQFISGFQPTENYAPLFEILTCKVDQKNEDLKNQLICALYMSKSVIPRQHFVLYLSYCSTIKCQSISVKEFNDNMQKIGISSIYDYFKSIMSTQSISSKIEKLASFIAEKPLTMLSTDIQLKLFECKLNGLHGFAGDKTVFLNIKEIKYLYLTCLYDHPNSVIDLTFIDI